MRPCDTVEMTRDEYLADPCGTSSLPYWKARTVRILEGIRVLHARQLREDPTKSGECTRYFRLIHRMKGLKRPGIPAGFEVVPLTPEAAAAHIRQCYRDISASPEELRAGRDREVFDGALWIAVRDRGSGEIAASGIGELDRELREGILEWIQVSPEYRRRGLGSFLVRELLWRMRDRADFVTVSGKQDDPCRPEALYRGCGFTGSDIWCVIRAPESGSKRNPVHRYPRSSGPDRL